MGTSRKNLFINAIVVSLFLAFLLISYRNLKVSEMWAFGDLVPFPKDIRITENWAFYMWNEEGMGLLSFKPFNYYLTMLVSSIFLGSIAAQKIMFLSTPVVSFLSLYFVLKKFKVSLMPSALGAFTYSINPITISELLAGSMTLVVYSVFPAIFFFTVRILKSKEFDLRNIIILGLLGFFTFNVHAALWYIIIFIPPLLLSVILGRIALRKSIRLAIPLVIVTFVLFPAILGYAGLYETTVSQNGSFVSDAVYCYKDSTFYNLVRLTGNKGSSQAEEYLSYNTLNSYTITGYAISIFGFSSLLVCNQQNSGNRRILAILVAIAFIFSSGLILLVKALPFVVELHPIMASLRNPVKLMYPLSFSICFLFAIGIEQLAVSIGTQCRRHDRNWNIVIGLALATIILLYNFPALDGTMSFSKVRDENYYMESKYYVLSDTLKKIEPNYESYRILFLPWEYSIQLKMGSEIPNYFGMPLGAGTGSKIDWLKDALEVATARDSIDRSRILGLFGVKYVTVDKSFKTSYDTQEWYENLRKRGNAVFEFQDSYWATGEPHYYYQIFRLDPNFELVYETNDFAIFENKVVVEKLHTASEDVNLNLSYTPVSENLLENPSFENQTENWQLWPSNLVSLTDNSSDQDRAIILFGQENFWTNCYQVVPVEETALYSLKFSVKAYNITDMHAKVLWYDVTSNLTEDNALFVDYIKLYQIGLESGEWSYIEETFSAPKHARKAMVWFGANRLGNFVGTQVYVDDVSFHETQIRVQNSDMIFSSIKNINYTKINPTKYIGETNSSSPFIIALSETYHSGWVCYVNGERVSSFPLYGIVNGFQINKTGQLDILIEYEPQIWFYTSSVVSLATLLACATYLAYDYSKPKTIWKRIRTKLKKSQEETSE